MSVDATHALFDWRRLNTVLGEHRFDGSRLYLSGPNQAAFRDQAGRVDAVRLTAALRDGATLILNAANEVSPVLHAHCQALAIEFTAHCQANLYACWRAQPGFNVHWDDHDVLVVQAEGRKRWSLYGLTRQSPLIAKDPIDHRPPAEPVDEIVLEAGDILYLPRGYWHAAVGLDEPSLHLTIGLTRRTGADFLHWLADQLVEEALVRSDLPFEEGEKAMEERVAALMQILAEQDLAARADAYRRHLEGSSVFGAALSLPAIGGAETAPSNGDLLTLAPGAARLERGAGESVVLTWQGMRFTVSAVLEPALERLVAGEAVRFDDLASAAPATRASEFVREMVGRAVLRLQAPD